MFPNLRRVPIIFCEIPCGCLNFSIVFFVIWRSRFGTETQPVYFWPPICDTSLPVTLCPNQVVLNHFFGKFFAEKLKVKKFHKTFCKNMKFTFCHEGILAFSLSGTLWPLKGWETLPQPFSPQSSQVNLEKPPIVPFKMVRWTNRWSDRSGRIV